jgi:phosphoribosylamine-glycine ligase
VARVGVGKIAEFFDGGENDVMRAAADFSRLIEDIGDRGGGNTGGLGDVANGESHRGEKTSRAKKQQRMRSIEEKKILDNESERVLFQKH